MEGLCRGEPEYRPMRNAQMTIPFMIATGTNEMRTTAKARRVDV